MIVTLTVRVTVTAVIEYNYKDDMKWSPGAAIFFAHREVGKGREQGVEALPTGKWAIRTGRTLVEQCRSNCRGA